MLDATQLNDYRKRILAGEDIPTAEYAEIIRAYRNQRGVAVETAAPKTKARAEAAAKAAPMDLGTLMAGIGLQMKKPGEGNG